jgi:hypothetical protein
MRSGTVVDKSLIKILITYLDYRLPKVFLFTSYINPEAGKLDQRVYQ